MSSRSRRILGMVNVPPTCLNQDIVAADTEMRSDTIMPDEGLQTTKEDNIENISSRYSKLGSNESDILNENYLCDKEKPKENSLAELTNTTQEINCETFGRNDIQPPLPTDLIQTNEIETEDKGQRMPKSLVPSYDSETTSLSELSDENMNRKEVVASKTNSFTKFSSSSSSSSTSSSSSSSSSSTSSSDDSDSSLEQPDNTEVEVAIQKTQEQPVDAHIEELKADANHYTPVRISNARSAESEDEDIIENTPEADGYISHRPAENSAARRTRPTVNPSIVISPVYTDESDFDNDIDDPTYNFEDKFANAANRNQRNFIVPPSSDSTSSDSETVTQQRGRKRKRNPEKWKQNQIKRLRNQGKSYVSMSKARKRIPSRCLKVPCTKKCRFECTDKISTMVRYELFTEFWKLGDINKQRAFVKSCLVDVEPKYKYTNAEKPRRPNQAYYFTVDNSKIRVCKLFFKSTLDISERMIYTTKTKTNDGRFTIEDFRGKHGNHRKLSTQLLDDIRKHINSIPRIESHYSLTNAYTQKQEISANKKKDLKELITKGLIPSYYANFYNSIL